ncbi:MAG: ribokinase [Alphaproteobacteria bacterium]|nr:ribokinase [Alphaproteobacteria bacterium]
MREKSIVILGVFVADTTYRAARPPRLGETVLGSRFALGPGGKGSNQSVAAARLGANVHLITRLGDDPFADMAAKTWAEAGVNAAVIRDPASYTGAAYIFIEEVTGDNAIIICPGAAAAIGENDVEANAALIRAATVFVTQLEQPLAAAVHALEIAHAAGVATILNPAPAAPLPDAVFALCDYITPNETEAEALTGIAVTSVDAARRAGDILLGKGVGAVVITMGEAGALLHARGASAMIPAFRVGPVVETTGAGDAFTAGFAVALSRGLEPAEAVRFGCAAAGVSVTRPGAAAAMPTLAEVKTVLALAEPSAGIPSGP